MIEFKGFPKIPRLEKFLTGMIVTEKIDGTNAAVRIEQLDTANNEELPAESINHWTDNDGVTWYMLAQSRKRIITPTKDDDNYGFAHWVQEHAEELIGLGHGTHYGEWWGLGIQRNYGAEDKRLSLFNVNRPPETLPECCRQVPVLYKGEFSKKIADELLAAVAKYGSVAEPGFMDPEGIMLWLPGVRQYVKHPIEKKHKGESA